MAMASKIKEFETAHNNLLSGYLIVLNDVSHLSFFVSLTPHFDLKSTKLWLKIIESIARALLVPFMIFALKPLVRLYTETHIVNRIREIKNIYTQYSLSATGSGKSKNSSREWFKQAVDDLQKLEDTFQTWKNIKDIARGFGVTLSTYLLAIFGLNSVFDIFPRTFNFINGITEEQATIVFTILIFLILFVLYGSLFIDSSFLEKRKIFLNKNNGMSVYELENKLYSHLGRKKTTEYQIDIGNDVLIYALSYAGIQWFQWMMLTFKKTNLNLNSICGSVIIVLIVWSYFKWKDRYQK